MLRHTRERGFGSLQEIDERIKTILGVLEDINWKKESHRSGRIRFVAQVKDAIRYGKKVCSAMGRILRYSLSDDAIRETIRASVSLMQMVSLRLRDGFVEESKTASEIAVALLSLLPQGEAIQLSLFDIGEVLQREWKRLPQTFISWLREAHKYTTRMIRHLWYDLVGEQLILGLGANR